MEDGRWTGWMVEREACVMVGDEYLEMDVDVDVECGWVHGSGRTVPVFQSAQHKHTSLATK